MSYLSLRDGFMRCKGTKNAMKSIICQIKSAQAIAVFMFLHGKCKLFVEQSLFFKHAIADIQYSNHIYSSLKERCTDMGITNRFKASYQTRSYKNKAAWKQETDCGIGCRKIGLD